MPEKLHPGSAVLRVCHVITGLNVGGAEMALTRLVERTRGGGLDSTVLSLGAGGALASRLRAAGATVEELGFSPRGPSPLRFARLASRLRSARPHVVQTWMYHADLAGGLASRLATRAPVAWSLRNSTLDPVGTPRATRLVVRACAALSRALPRRIVSCSRAAMEVHAALGYDRERMEWIPNGFDLDALRPDADARAAVRRDLGASDGAVLVGSFARFAPQKDFGTLIAALALAPAAVRLVVAGEGATEDTPAVARLVGEAGVASRVTLLGPRDDVPRLLAGLDVVTTSSAWGEAFPQVVGEAMATGVPCVVTDVGDSAEIVGDAGLVVPPRSPAKLAAAWMRLASLPEAERRRLSARARERIAERYEIGAVAARWIDLWNRILSE